MKKNLAPITQIAWSVVTPRLLLGPDRIVRLSASTGPASLVMRWVFAADADTRVWSVHPFAGEINLQLALKRAWGDHPSSILKPPNTLLLANEGPHYIQADHEDLDQIAQMGVGTIGRVGAGHIPMKSASHFIDEMTLHVQKSGGTIHWSDLSRWAMEYQGRMIADGLTSAESDLNVDLHRTLYMQNRPHRPAFWNGPVSSGPKDLAQVAKIGPLNIDETYLDDLIGSGLQANNIRGASLVAALERVLAFRPRYGNRWDISDEMRASGSAFTSALESGDVDLSEADALYVQDCIAKLAAAGRCDARLGRSFSISSWAREGLLAVARSEIGGGSRTTEGGSKLRQMSVMAASIPRSKRSGYLVAMMRESKVPSLVRAGTMINRYCERSLEGQSAVNEDLLELIGSTMEAAASREQWHAYHGGLTIGQKMHLGGKEQTLTEDIAISENCRIKVYEHGPRFLIKWRLTEVIPASHSSWSTGTASFDSIQTVQSAVSDLCELVYERRFAVCEQTLMPLVNLCKTLSLGRYRCAVSLTDTDYGKKGQRVAFTL